MKKMLLALTLISCCANSYAKTVNLGTTEIYSDTGYENSLRNTTSSPFIVTSKEIEEKRFTTLSEVLASIPGVSIREGYEAEIDLRGQGYRKARATVQILIDGVPINVLDTSHKKVPLNTINPNQIERVEVIPGGGSVLYGNGTAGGVINVITKKYKGTYGNLGYRYGSFGDHKYDVAVGTSLNKFDFSFDYSKDDKSGYRKKSDSNSDYFSARIAYNFNANDNIAFKYRAYRVDFNQYNKLNREQITKDRRQNGMSKNNKEYVNRKTDEFTLILNKKINENNNLILNAYKIENDIRNITEKIEMGVYNKKIVKSEDNREGIKIKNKLIYGNNNIVFGVGYTNHNMFLNNIKIEKKTIESFALNTLKFGRLEFSQGLRYERAKYEGDTAKAFRLKNAPTSKTLSNVAASLALNYLYSDTGNIYAKYENAFNTPAPLQSIKNTNWITTTSDAKEEKSNTFEIGLRDYIEPLNSTVSASVYYSETKDELKTVWLGRGFHSLSDFNTINYGKTKRYGFDLKAEQKFGNLRLSESYSFINAKIVKVGESAKEKLSEGKYIPDVPRHKLALSIDYDVNEKLSLGATYQYQAAAYIDNQNKQGKEGKKSTVDLRMNYNINENLSLYAGVKNLFNYKYNDAITYDERAKMKLYDPAPTVNYYLGFNYKF